MMRDLEKAVAILNTLPDVEQDAIAAIILEEIDNYRKWDGAFEQTQSQLSKLASKAHDDFKAGRVREMGIDEL